MAVCKFVDLVLVLFLSQTDLAIILRLYQLDVLLMILIHFLHFSLMSLFFCAQVQISTGLLEVQLLLL